MPDETLPLHFIPGISGKNKHSVTKLKSIEYILVEHNIHKLVYQFHWSTIFDEIKYIASQFFATASVVVVAAAGGDGLRVISTLS